MKLNLPKPNLIDSIVGVFSEQAKTKRLIARAAGSYFGSGGAYEGASHTKKSMQGWHTSLGDANSDTVFDMATLRSRGRDLVRNNSIAASASNVHKNGVIGTGLKLHPKINNEFLNITDEEARAWERDVKFKFNSWAKNKVSFDIQKKINFYESQQLVITSVFAAGDIFATTPRVKRKGIEQDTRIQLIEGDRVCNPNGKINGPRLTEGVEVDGNGAPIAYHIRKTHPHAVNPIDLKNDTVRIPAFGPKTGRQNVLHIFNMERPDQRRGVSGLAVIMTKVKQLGRYTDAEIMAAVVSGMFTVFVKKEIEDEDILDEALTDQESETFPKVTGGGFDQGAEDNTYRMGNGSIVGMGKGDSVEFANPSRPNTAYDPFVNSIYKEMGASLDIPYEVLLKHFSSSYSASRAAILELWKMFKVKRQWMANQYCQPIFETWLSEAISKGQVEAPGFFDSNLVKSAYCGCAWVGDSKGQIDPVKETLGMQMQEDRGYMTAEQITTELHGTEWDRNMSQRKKEQNIRVEFGLNTKPLEPEVIERENDKKTD